jgi:hypothetical protein
MLTCTDQHLAWIVKTWWLQKLGETNVHWSETPHRTKCLQIHI